MGPTKVVIRDNALYEVKTGKLVKDGFADSRAIEQYAARHYIVLPVMDNAGRPWLLEDQPVYCLRGSRYETVNDQQVQLTRCPDCGGMGIRNDEVAVESDCICCTGCGHEFDTRLEMMEN